MSRSSRKGQRKKTSTRVEKQVVSTIPVIPTVRLANAPRLTPSVQRIMLERSQGCQHLILYAEGSRLASGILLGKLNETGGQLSKANIWLDVTRPKVVLVFGRRGTGKSYDLGVLIEGLASEPGMIRIGTQRPPIVVFDPKSEFWTLGYEPDPEDPQEKTQLELLELWGLRPRPIEDIAIFVPSGTPKRHPDSISFRINIRDINEDDWCDFFKFNKYNDLQGQLLSAAYRQVIEAQGIDYTIQDLIDCIQSDDEINDPKFGYAVQTIRAVVRRLSDLKGSPLFSSGDALNIQSVFKKGQVSIFLLRGVGEDTRSLIVSQVVRRIVKARGEAWENSEIARRLQARADREESGIIRMELIHQAEALRARIQDRGVPPGWVFVDEAHTLCPSEGYSAAKRVLIEYVKQGRAMGLSLGAATQQPSALSRELLSQRDLIILHHLGIKSDIDAALQQMNPSFPERIGTARDGVTTNVPRRLVNSLNRGEAIVSCDEASRNFLIKIRPRVSAHGGKEPFLI